MKGRLSAGSEEQATELLGYVGYKVVSLKPLSQLLDLDRLRTSLSCVKPSEIILFYRQLALLIESGINIVTSLELLEDKAENRALKKVLGEVIAELRSGQQFSMALSRHPKVFSPIYRRLLGVGEQTGGLEVMLKQIADYIEKETTTAKNIKGALMYPVIAGVITIAVTGLLVLVVFPAIGRLYSSLGAELPPVTKMLMAIADGLKSYGVYILLALLVTFGLLYIYIRTPNGRYNWDKLNLSLPLLGRVNHVNELARSCRSLALLYRAGIPLTEAVPMVTQSSSNRVVVEALTQVQQNMLSGQGLSGPMAENPFFLPMMVQMVRVGEETGKLDTTLLAVAQNYEVEAEDKLRSVIVLIQPAMTLIIGLIIGFIALSLAQAMYSIYGQTI